MPSKKRTWNSAQKTPFWDNTLKIWCKPVPYFKLSVPRPAEKRLAVVPPVARVPLVPVVPLLPLLRQSAPIWDLSYVVQLELWEEPRELPIHNRYLWSNIKGKQCHCSSQPILFHFLFSKPFVVAAVQKSNPSIFVLSKEFPIFWWVSLSLFYSETKWKSQVFEFSPKDLKRLVVRE